MKPVDDGYRMLAAQCLRKQASRLTKQIKLVGAEGQLEVIHQARVAARRLTAAFCAFAPHLPRKKAKRWRRDISRAVKRLGAARDKDVQIVFLRKVLKKTPDRTLRPGIRRLMVRIRQERHALQPKVVKAAGKLRKSGTLKAIRRRADAMLASLPPEGATIQTPAVFAARQQILKSLDRVVAYESCLFNPAGIAQHHEMRIAAKELRYTMELFRPAYEGDLDGSLAATKKLQDMLGDLHDCDAWGQLLPDFLDGERKRAESYFGNASPVKRLKAGIEHLQAARRDDRERIFAELGDYWHKLSADGTWQSLTAMLNERFAHAEAAEAARAAEQAARAAEEAAPAQKQAQDKAAEDASRQTETEAAIETEEDARAAEVEPPIAAEDTSLGAEGEPNPAPQPPEAQEAPPREYQVEGPDPEIPIPGHRVADKPETPDSASG